ncbi:hypothetical protein ACHHYP_11304 [Achlya hypogyna]|uniref:Uncharacterized protein n=1 Tax=Achlya hypogyna TaxID=1202772 RepID=A0A1V9YJH9_ACHHY|nr:hypothetical protein ACHHYP_11304 [Achlya hypogyna]
MQTRARAREQGTKELLQLPPETKVHIQINILTTPSSPTYHYYTRSRAHTTTTITAASTTKTARRQRKRAKAKKKLQEEPKEDGSSQTSVLDGAIVPANPTTAIVPVEPTTAVVSVEPTVAIVPANEDEFSPRRLPALPPPPRKRRCIDVDALLDDLTGLCVSTKEDRLVTSMATTSITLDKPAWRNPFAPALQPFDHEMADLLESIHACHITRPEASWDDFLIQMSSIRLVAPERQHEALESTLAQFTGLSLADSRHIVSTHDYQYLHAKLNELAL